jgi:hypothetical protein
MNAFWDASIYADEQMAKDEGWAESDEAKLLNRLLERESERLKAVINSRKAKK